MIIKNKFTNAEYSSRSLVFHYNKEHPSRSYYIDRKDTSCHRYYYRDGWALSETENEIRILKNKIDNLRESCLEWMTLYYELKKQQKND